METLFLNELKHISENAHTIFLFPLVSWYICDKSKFANNISYVDVLVRI